MHVFSRMLTALASVVLMLGLAQSPAMAASEAGTHAWSTNVLTLRAGPGTQYGVSGELGSGLAIMVLRCQKLWCLVDGDTGRGWTSKQAISFGKTATPWPGSVNPNYPTGGTICLYTGANYTGSEFCLSSGRVINDLALLGLDNSFASIQVNSTSVAACRDRSFQSYCERIVTSKPVLNQYLRNALSSIHVY